MPVQDKRNYMLLATISAIVGMLAAEATDIPARGMADTLAGVTVVADRTVAVPIADTVKTEGFISITDAFASAAGLYVADYGGMAGQKSVSMRAMGSPHTAIYVDGVRISDARSGQPDLGMFDLDNSDSVVVDYSRSSISFNTAKPVLHTRPVGGRLKMRGGSFGTYEPSARLDFRLSDRVSLSATAGGVLSKGDFPLPDGSRRLNNDIRRIRAAIDSWGKTGGGNWHAKAFYNGAQRGTPGTLDWPSTDRQKDSDVSLQGVVNEQITPFYALDASARVCYNELEYRSQWSDSAYKQTRAQLGTTHKFSVCSWADVSFAADFGWDSLWSGLYNASRVEAGATASAAFHPGLLKAVIALEYAGTFDRGERPRNILLPSFDIRWNAFDGFSLFAFARRAYRRPTFNELFYPGYGNPDLKAEDACMTDLGIEYTLLSGGNWRFQIKADGFFNYLKDKIISAPTPDDPNIWLPYNIGVVQMAGADTKACANYEGSILKAGFSARYSYQSATDKTPGSTGFGQQIPFISRHTVSASANARAKGWNAAIYWNWRGHRYDSAGRMPDYGTLDLVMGKDIGLPADLALGLKFIARNLTDCRYALAGGYPMPGRAFYGEIDFKF